MHIYIYIVCVCDSHLQTLGIMNRKRGFNEQQPRYFPILQCPTNSRGIELVAEASFSYFQPNSLRLFAGPGPVTTCSYPCVSFLRIFRPI